MPPRTRAASLPAAAGFFAGRGYDRDQDAARQIPGRVSERTEQPGCPLTFPEPVDVISFRQPNPTSGWKNATNVCGDPERHAFIAMPFSEPFNDVYHYGIAPPVRAAGLFCIRVDQTPFTGDVLDRMKQGIATSIVVVADLSGANPNVYLEVGLAWGMSIPCILLCNRDTDLKFDVRGQRCLLYSSIRELEASLVSELCGLLNNAHSVPPRADQ